MVGCRGRQDHQVSIVGMDQRLQSSEVDWPTLRCQLEDPVGFVRPDAAVRLDVPFPVADVGDALGFLQSGFALSQVAKHQQRGQRIGQPAADLLEQSLFLRRPDSGVRALVQSEQVCAIALGVDGHRNLRLDAEALGHRLGQRMV